MYKTLIALTAAASLTAIGLTAQASRNAALSSTYSLVGLSDDGNTYVVDSGLSYDDCRTSDRAARYDVSYCERQPRLVGLDCEGASGPIYAASESDFPPCRYIARINGSN